MPERKWEFKYHDTEDPYYEITNGQISLVGDCGFVGETDAEEDNIFRNVFNAINGSGIDFRSNNPLELEQHIIIQELQYKIQDATRALEMAYTYINTPTLGLTRNDVLNSIGLSLNQLRKHTE